MQQQKEEGLDNKYRPRALNVNRLKLPEIIRNYCLNRRLPFDLTIALLIKVCKEKGLTKVSKSGHHIIDTQKALLWSKTESGHERRLIDIEHANRFPSRLNTKLLFGSGGRY